MTNLIDNLLVTAAVQEIIAAVIAGRMSHEQLLAALRSCPIEIIVAEA